MTIEKTISKTRLPGDGANKNFDYQFSIPSLDDLKIIYTNSAGVESTITSNYTITGIGGGESGGTLTYPTSGSAILSNESITIKRVKSLKQKEDLRNQGDFFAEVHEEAFDIFVMMIQQLQEQIDRAAKLKESSSNSNPELPEPSTGKALLWKSDGNLENSADDFNNIVTNATTQANNAATSATNAANSATAASTSETNAATSASNASTSATEAAASATAAQNAASSNMYDNVITITNSDSPYTIGSDKDGTLFRVDTSGGVVDVNLPNLATVAEDFRVAIAKITGDVNQVTINRSGSDAINGANTRLITALNNIDTLVGDYETNSWLAFGGGQGSGNLIIDSFSGDSSQTAFTLSQSPASENNLQIFISGVYQNKSEFSISGTTLTFTEAPPTGTNNIEVVFNATTPIGTPSDGTVTTAKIVDNAITEPKLDNSVINKLLPAGMVSPFAMITPPTGWLECNGAAISRTTYSDLFSAIGTNFGSGDGSTTFNLPDLRGEFVRGWDNGKGTDSGRFFASFQDYSIENITGSFYPGNGHITNESGAFASGSVVNKYNGGNYNYGGDGITEFDASRVVKTSNETRPRNIALMYCIKY